MRTIVTLMCTLQPHGPGLAWPCRLLHQMSAAGSTLIMTCPPTLAAKAHAESLGQKLHHQVFEEPEQTVERWVCLSSISQGQQYLARRVNT